MSEVWNKVKPEGNILKPLEVHGLVGVDGIPIKVQGVLQSIYLLQEKYLTMILL